MRSTHKGQALLEHNYKLIPQKQLIINLPALWRLIEN